MENIIIDLTKEKNVTQDGFPSSVRHVDAGVEFGLKELKGVCLDVPVFDKSSQYLSVPKDDYVFNPEQLRNILSFLNCANTLYIGNCMNCCTILYIEHKHYSDKLYAIYRNWEISRNAHKGI